MKLFSISALAGLLLAGIIIPAYAAGEAPAADTPDATKTQAEIDKEAKTCKETKGKVWDLKTKKCVDQQAGLLDDDSLFETGRFLADAGRYDEAITVLNFVANAKDKRVLTALGFSYRKSGQVDVGLKYYTQALEVDPDYVLAREYLGETLIQKGDIEGAKVQLLEIKNRCGETCEVYVDLSKQIDAAIKS